MLMRRFNFVKWGLLMVGAGLLAACSDSDSSDPGAAQQPAAQSASTLDAAKAAGKIRIGYANEAPYAYMDSKEARVTGESVEIARVVLKRMGIDEVEGVLTEFGSLIGPAGQAVRHHCRRHVCDARTLPAGCVLRPDLWRGAGFPGAEGQPQESA